MEKVTKVLIIAVFVHLVIFSGLSILLYRNTGYGLTNGGDLAIVNQFCWSTIHGRFFELTVDSFAFETLQPHGYFMNHFEPIYLFCLFIHCCLGSRP